MTAVTRKKAEEHRRQAKAKVEMALTCTAFLVGQKTGTQKLSSGVISSTLWAIDIERFTVKHNATLEAYP